MWISSKMLLHGYRNGYILAKGRSALLNPDFARKEAHVI